MLKNYISIALLFAICWSIKAEAVMGMSASKALSYSNTVRGIVGDGESRGSVKPVVVKKQETTPEASSTYTITMNDKDPSKVEKKSQALKGGDYLNVMLPPFSWSVDTETCREKHVITATRISFTILGTTSTNPSCEIKLYGYNEETSEIINKIITLMVN